MAITPPDEPVRRHGPWKNNAELMVDVNRLGYLVDPVFDATYGLKGGFWNHYRPGTLITNDLDSRSSTHLHADFTHLPLPDQAFPTVVFDPPYKLNGTPTMDYDERYGIAEPTHWKDRLALILRGTTECARVTSRYLLVKCQNQVCNNAIRWQRDMVTKVATVAGLDKVDEFELSSYRPQPAGRSQCHTRSDTTHLLIFERN